MASNKPPAGAPAPSAASKPTVKQERELRRQAKVEAFKKEQARTKRNRLLAIWLSSAAGVAVLALVATFVIIGSTPKQLVELTGLKTWDVPGAVHVDPQPVDYKADYEMDPPAGGPHWSAWLNCGVYDQPQENERAVHSLEHGAIWVTYNPDTTTSADIATLRKNLPSSYIVISPYPGLSDPFVASAWGAQIRFKDVNDPRLDTFVAERWKSGTAPELGASCSGAVDGPGKIG